MRAAALLLYVYYLLLRATLRIERHGAEAIEDEANRGLGVVLAVPHFSLLAVTLAWDGFPATLLASLSKDGALAASLMARRGFRMVRGSSSRGGREALELLVEAARAHETVAITFDGPRGPALKPKAGVALVSHVASGSLFFVYAEALPSALFKRPLAIRLRSWDRFLLPLPFARLRVAHERIDMSDVAKGDAQGWIATALERIEGRARARC